MHARPWIGQPGSLRDSARPDMILPNIAWTPIVIPANRRQIQITQRDRIWEASYCNTKHAGFQSHLWEHPSKAGNVDVLIAYYYQEARLHFTKERFS